MKKAISAILLVALIFTLWTPIVSAAPISVNSPVSLASLTQTIVLDQSEVTIVRLQKIKLTASFAPADASTKAKWTTSNRRVASVSSNGLVTGVKAGTAVITCTAKDGSGVSASCTVTVIPIDPTSVRISKTTVILKPNKTVSLKATVSPKNTDFKSVTWTSDNPGVATVTYRGKVKGVGEGTATITASTTNGITASCTVTVSMIYPSGIRLNKTAITLKSGKAYTLKATLSPKKNDFKTVTWTSDNIGIATVTSKGKVKAVSPGTATITATTANGIIASCTVNVPGTPIVPTPPPAPELPPVPTYTYLDPTYEQAVCNGVNWARQNNGTAPTSILVSLDANLTAQARDHAMKMAVAGDIFHSGLGYAESVTRGASATNGEGEGVVAAAHAGSLIDPRVTLLGVGAVQTSDGTVYLCVMGFY